MPNTHSNLFASTIASLLPLTYSHNILNATEKPASAPPSSLPPFTKSTPAGSSARRHDLEYWARAGLAGAVGAPCLLRPCARQEERRSRSLKVVISALLGESSSLPISRERRSDHRILPMLVMNWLCTNHANACPATFFAQETSQDEYGEDTAARSKNKERTESTTAACETKLEIRALTRLLCTCVSDKES